METPSPMRWRHLPTWAALRLVTARTHRTPTWPTWSTERSDPGDWQLHLGVRTLWNVVGLQCVVITFMLTPCFCMLVTTCNAVRASTTQLNHCVLYRCLLPNDLYVFIIFQVLTFFGLLQFVFPADIIFSHKRPAPGAFPHVNLGLSVGYIMPTLCMCLIVTRVVFGLVLQAVSWSVSLIIFFLITIYPSLILQIFFYDSSCWYDK